MGVITKPSVPEVKQVNLYQKGFLSSNKVPLHLEGTVLPPQIGTDNCEKEAVPQTGKAVSGFCPKVEHTWAVKLLEKNKKSIKQNSSVFFITS